LHPKTHKKGKNGELKLLFYWQWWGAKLPCLAINRSNQKRKRKKELGSSQSSPSLGDGRPSCT